MAKPIHRKMTVPLARECRRLVHRVAKEYDVPPACITAHIRGVRVDAARVQVWREMVDGMGMTRQLVADSFGRDRRRIRASVLAKCSGIFVLPDPVPVKKRTVAFQPVGNQFVWSFAVPLVIARPVPVQRFMRPVPGDLRNTLAGEDRKRLIQFYEREARLLRKSAAGA